MAIGPRRRSRSRSRARLRSGFASRAIPSIIPLTSDPPDPPEIFSYRRGPVSIPRFVMHGGQRAVSFVLFSRHSEALLFDVCHG